MKTTSKGLYYLSKVASGAAVSIVGGGIIAPTVTMFLKEQSMDTNVLWFSLAMFVAFLTVASFGYLLECKGHDYEQQEQLIATTHKRKHKIRIPRNTTVSVEVED